MDGFWDVSYWLVYRGDLLSQVAVSTGFIVIERKTSQGCIL